MAAPGVWESLVGAFAMMLVIEGLLPFVSPRRWRSVFEEAAKMSDGQIRFVGLLSMAGGLTALYFFMK